MHHIDVLLTSDLAGGAEPFQHGELRIAFHRWAGASDLPLVEGALWAFVDWVLPEMSGLEICRRLRCDPMSAQAHITVVLEEDDADAKRRSIRAGEACTTSISSPPITKRSPAPGIRPASSDVGDSDRGDTS